MLNIVQDFNPIQFQQDLMGQVYSASIGYLGISITIIFGLAAIGAALGYLLSIKPLLKQISEQGLSLLTLRKKIDEERISNEERIKDLSQSLETEKLNNENKILELVVKQEESLNNVIEKITVAEKRETEELVKLREETETLYQDLRKKTEELEIYLAWYDHYTWRLNEIHLNELISVTRCLGKIMDYKRLKSLIPLCLEAIERILEKYPDDEFKDDKEDVGGYLKNITSYFSEFAKENEQNKQYVAKIRKLMEEKSLNG